MSHRPLTSSPHRFGPASRPAPSTGTGPRPGPVMRNTIVPAYRPRPETFGLRQGMPGQPAGDRPAGRSLSAPVPAPAAHTPHPAHAPLDGFDEVPFREMLQRLHRDVPFAKAVVLSVMPRGGLQALLPGHADETLARGLSRGLHRHDRVSWKAIRDGGVVTSGDVYDADVSSPLFSDLLDNLRLHHHAAVRLRQPVLPGYDGVLVLYRDAGADGFDDREVRAIADFGQKLERQLDEHHPKADPAGGMPLPHDLPNRVFVIDAAGNVLLPGNGLADVEAKSPRLAHVLLDEARRAIAKHAPETKDATPGGRVPLSDDLGDRWAARISVLGGYEALGADGPVAFVTVQPEVGDWAALRPGHFPADEEVARLVPALQFMYDQYATGPSLEDTAKVVHLSPFHFHRRFTELLGVTPKHYLFDCQIAAAKSKLIAGEELAKIADDCGFAHQSHFTSRFKQATGLTPTRWRKLARSQG